MYMVPAATDRTARTSLLEGLCFSMTVILTARTSTVRSLREPLARGGSK